MRDRTIIAVGLGAFIVLVTFPMWYGIASGGNTSPPTVKLVTQQSTCVESKQWMIANHPKLLRQWRNAVVRDASRKYTSKTYGRQFEMSLTKTCMQCHGARQEFCDRCHNYADVSLNCWNCHQDAKGNRL